ncbi:aminotransferase class I/II-fold pyridoxal phosphate-dependent enzyme [Hymenobacter gummosus]|uniref:Aminotransferase class I/II-fold pyridoxal phosphate-dependent enzyme n=1 Tax=Hymenobacter gummosus TaxID=1776032 RepID=A0A3S0JB83_9BACT|nr:aminotransferase class I/II-fold pyridoxal phosphate-dependent enzyme [Hymenobacter gummosus]RTQ46253.1 aminotransferase class I/II-fold pyridoxal phosphate-dependent enzyme [Hymenobacter gummosus]
MNTLTINRRQWLRASALLTGHLLLGGSSQASAPQRPAGPGPTGLARLDGEQHPWGPSPQVREALSRALDFPPDAARLTEKLRRAIAQAEQVSPAQVVLGNGSTALFGLAAQLAGVAGGQLLASTPTYQPWMDYAARLGAQVRGVPVAASTQPDFGLLLAHLDGPRLLYLSNPNYPFGGLLQPTELAPFCRQAAARTLVLIDEASLPYVSNHARCSMVQLVRAGVENVVVTRTFAKLHALPGLKVGYAIAGPRTAARLAALQATPEGDGGIATPALAAALAAQQDTRHAERVRTAARRLRAELHRRLDLLALPYEPSFAGYVSFSLASLPAIAPDYLHMRGLHLHYFTAQDGATWARTALGAPEQLLQLTDQLTELRRAFPLGSQPARLLVAPAVDGPQLLPPR